MKEKLLILNPTVELSVTIVRDDKEALEREAMSLADVWCLCTNDPWCMVRTGKLMIRGIVDGGDRKG